MKTNFTTNVIDFLNRAGDALRGDEARFGLIYGIVRSLVGNPHLYGPEDPWFCTVEGEGKLLAAAMRTPPYNVLLAHFSNETDSITGILADAISQFSPVIPGVIGESVITGPFVENWCRVHGVTVAEKMGQQQYRLDKINEITCAPGSFHLAEEADKELLTEWAKAFFKEVFTPSSSSSNEGNFELKIDNKETYVWDDNGPVSMAVKSRPTDNGMTVGMVYTPPELRQKGYATSCVTGVCREILADGYKFCTLYTDISNPVSNSIYRKIGFREICDSVMYTFSGPSD